MSKKCIKCGQPLPDEASFCPHCTAVQTEKKEIKTTETVEEESVDHSEPSWILSAVVGTVFSMHHEPQRLRRRRADRLSG